MIRCQLCNKVTEKYESTYEIVMEKVARTYRNVILSGRLPGRNRQFTIKSNNEIIIKKYLELGFKILKEFITEGWEIKRMARVCKDCYTKNYIKI